MYVTVTNKIHVVSSKVVHLPLLFIGHSYITSVYCHVVDKLSTALVLRMEWLNNINPIIDWCKHALSV